MPFAYGMNGYLMVWGQHYLLLSYRVRSSKRQVR